MSTRCNIVVTDQNFGTESRQYFYRHSDGYPEGALPLLRKFLKYVKAGGIRDNAGQASGWLIIFGAQEYNYCKDFKAEEYGKPNDDLPLNSYSPEADPLSGWKVGSIEPTDCIHEDIEFLYEVDLTKKEIRYTTVDFDESKDCKDRFGLWKRTKAWVTDEEDNSLANAS